MISRMKGVLNISDLNLFKQITTEMAKCASSERERKMIADFRRYITNNWGFITIRNGKDCGSLSPKVSRKPRTFL